MYTQIQQAMDGHLFGLHSGLALFGTARNGARGGGSGARTVRATAAAVGPGRWGGGGIKCHQR